MSVPVGRTSQRGPVLPIPVMRFQQTAGRIRADSAYASSPLWGWMTCPGPRHQKAFRTKNGLRTTPVRIALHVDVAAPALLIPPKMQLPTLAVATTGGGLALAAVAVPAPSGPKERRPPRASGTNRFISCLPLSC